MKNFLRGTGLLLVLFAASAQASTIDGILDFTGEVVPIFGPGLEDAVGLSFSQILITDSSGDFEDNGIGFADVGTIFSFFFADGAVTPFIQINFDPGPGKFSFDLDSFEIQFQSDSFLLITGTGTLNGTGFDPTPYDLSLSVDGIPGANIFSSSGTLAPSAVVPVPGALLLFMSGLTALGLRRRS